MTKMKKLKALGVMALMVGGLLAVTGCDRDPLLEQEVKQAIADAKELAYKEGAESVDITADNSEAVQVAMVQEQLKSAEQASRDSLIIEDYKNVNEALKAELIVKEKIVEAAIIVEARNEDSYTKDELALEAGVTAFTLDDSDLNFLQDAKIKFDGDRNIDIKEEIVFADVGVRTSVYDEEFEEDVYLTVESEEGILYKYSFDDDVVRTIVSKSEPLNINFLGKDIEIVDVASDSFTVISGEELLLKEGETVTISIDGEDVEIELVTVSDSSNEIAIKINGAMEAGLSEGDIEEVGNYEVYVKTVLSNEAGEGDDIAEIRVGKDIEKEYEDGDEVVEDDERFVYKIAMKAGTDNIDYFGVAYAEVSNNKDDEYAPITGDEQIIFPNEFFKVGIALEDVDYFEYSFKFSEKNEVSALKIESDDGEGIVIGTDKVDKVYFNGTDVIYDDDNGDEQVVLLSAVKLENDDMSLSMSFDGSNFAIGSDIKFVIDPTMSFLGATEDEAEAADIKYKGTGYGSQDESIVTSNGLVIVSPEDNANADKFKLLVPSKIVEAKIIVE